MNEKLLSLKDEIKSRLGETQDLTDLDKIRVSYLGKKGSITALLKGMKDLPNEERKTFGAEVNKLKAQAAQLIEERLAELKEKEIQREIALMPQFDITSPVALARGSYHPITLVQRECEKIFSSMGFNIEDYSEIVTDYECFEALNIPKHHPARDMQDTYYLDNGQLLKSHTSAAQNAILKKYGKGLIENGNKEKFFGVFTDTDELFKWKDTQNAQKVVTDFDSIAQMVMDPQADVKGFVINPFGKSVTFPKQMVHSFKQQKDYMKLKNQTIEPGSPISLGEPKEYPIDLMAALINHFSTEPTVNAAYLRLIEQNGQKSYFIVVDFFGDMESTFDAISKVANPFLDDEIQLSMMPYSMDFAKNAVKGVEPFYRKEN